MRHKRDSEGLCTPTCPACAHGDGVSVYAMQGTKGELQAEVERLRKALEAIHRKSAVGPPDPPGPKANVWYNRLVEVSADAHAALAGAPSETRLTHASVGCACGGSASWPHGPHDERREQDRALAERVRERIAERLTQGYERDAAAIVRALDLDALLEEP